jgi:hypothetical protein
MEALEFQEQIFGIVMTLCALYEKEGLSSQESRAIVSELLSNIAESLKTLPESNSNV